MKWCVGYMNPFAITSLISPFFIFRARWQLCVVHKIYFLIYRFNISYNFICLLKLTLRLRLRIVNGVVEKCYSTNPMFKF